MTKRNLPFVLAAAALPLLGGAFAGVAATGSRPPAPRDGELAVQSRPFRFEREVNDPYLIQPERWLALPELRGDFDLVAQVELGEGAEFDLVLRRVEPRELNGMTVPMHGRFRVLRMSTRGSGEPWRTEEQALFGKPGGLSLAAGSPATVQVEARGRRLEAVVAGRRLPVFTAADDYGGVVGIARGGTVALRSLVITPVGRADPLPPWVGGALAGLLVGGLGALLRRAPWRLLAGGVLLVGAAEVVRSFAFAGMPPLAYPDATDELLVALSGAPLALLLLLPGRVAVLGAVLGIVAGGVMGRLPLQNVAARFPAQPMLDEVFGPDAGDHLVSALAQRLPGPLAVSTLEPCENRVFLLGGQLLYERGAAPDEHVQTLLLGELRRTHAHADVDVVALPTVDGWSAQQWQLFSRLYTGFRPRVLVFGVPRDEAAIGDDGGPRSSATALAATVAAAVEWCGGHDCRLVLLADGELPFQLADVLRAASEGAAYVSYLRVPSTATPLEFAEQLAAIIEPLLGR